MSSASPVTTWVKGFSNVYVSVCLFSTEGACNHGQCIINTVSRRCTVILDKSPGPAIGNITIPATHQKYTCTMKENTSFLSSWRCMLRGWKALGSQRGLSTWRKKVGLLSNVQLIKLWCIPSPCKSMCCILLFFFSPSPALQCPACSSNYPQARLCFISLDWVSFFFFSIKASTLASKWPRDL